MHSRIFGIIPQKNYKKNTKIQHNETETFMFADYVDEDTNLNDDFEWFVNVLQKNNNDYFKFDKETHTLTFFKGFKECYFKEKFEKIKELLNKKDFFKNVFCCDTFEVYDLKELVRPYYGMFVCDENGYYNTLDDFVRDIVYNEKYKVFQSIDYHY